MVQAEIVVLRRESKERGRKGESDPKGQSQMVASLVRVSGFGLHSLFRFRHSEFPFHIVQLAMPATMPPWHLYGFAGAR
jgi:hypothetical protein